MNSENVIQVLDGSRRVGWARFYATLEEVDQLKAQLRELGDAVVFHPRIHSEDPILALARKAQSV